MASKKASLRISLLCFHGPSLRDSSRRSQTPEDEASYELSIPAPVPYPSAERLLLHSAKFFITLEMDGHAFFRTVGTDSELGFFQQFVDMLIHFQRFAGQLGLFVGQQLGRHTGPSSFWA